MEFHARYDGFYGAFIHDALAVAAALDPALIRTQAVARRRRARRDADDRRDGRLARVWGRRERRRGKPTPNSCDVGGRTAAAADVAHSGEPASMRDASEGWQSWTGSSDRAFFVVEDGTARTSTARSGTEFDRRSRLVAYVGDAQTSAGSIRSSTPGRSC